jgi:hypothetical protein
MNTDNSEPSIQNKGISGTVQKVRGPRRGSHHMFPLPARDDDDDDDDNNNNNNNNNSNNNEWSNPSGSEQNNSSTVNYNKGPYGRPAYLPYEELLEPILSKPKDDDNVQPVTVVVESNTEDNNDNNDNDDNDGIISGGNGIQAPGDKHALEVIQKKNQSQAELLEQYNKKLQSDKYTSLSQGEAAKLQQMVDSQDLPGGSNFRPLVGGFAAAAYEAAKAHHYETKKATSLGHVRD